MVSEAANHGQVSPTGEVLFWETSRVAWLEEMSSTGQLLNWTTHFKWECMITVWSASVFYVYGRRLSINFWSFTLDNCRATCWLTVQKLAWEIRRDYEQKDYFYNGIETRTASFQTWQNDGGVVLTNLILPRCFSHVIRCFQAEC